MMAAHKETVCVPEQPASTGVESAVPGLTGRIEALRKMYPELTLTALARVFRLPTQEIERLLGKPASEI